MRIKAFELTVEGNVQAVGYRRIVAKIARRLRVSGYVRNLNDGRVKILAQGEEQSLEELVRSITIDEPPIKVEKVERRERKPNTKFRSFTIQSGTIIEELQEGKGWVQEKSSSRYSERSLAITEKDSRITEGSLRITEGSSETSHQGQMKISKLSETGTARFPQSLHRFLRRWKESLQKRGENLQGP